MITTSKIDCLVSMLARTISGVLTHLKFPVTLSTSRDKILAFSLAIINLSTKYKLKVEIINNKEGEYCVVLFMSIIN